MIPVANPIAEPPLFAQNCRTPGNQWLIDNPTAKSSSFPALWTKFEAELEAGFRCRCGWWAMRIASGTVDHFLSKTKAVNRHLVYEWSNYRHAAATLNSSKLNVDDRVLDPFEVQADWFEVLLPSMQLVRTNHVPLHLQAKADFTLTRLHLDYGIKVRRNRKRWYDDHKKGLPMCFLEDYAPQVADAVKKWIATGQPLP